MKHYVKQQIVSESKTPTISLDAENDNGGTLHDSVSGENIDEQISLYNSLMALINKKKNTFTKREKTVISLFLDGYEIKEISKILKMNKTTAYRTYHSAINKIRHSLINKK